MDKASFFILYIGPGERAGMLDFPEREWEIAAFDSPDALSAMTRRPDMVLMDPFGAGKDEDIPLARTWLDQFRSMTIKYPPPVFAVIPEGGGENARTCLMEAGFDDAVQWPVSQRLLSSLARCHVGKVRIAQELGSTQASLDRSFAYLDRFKQEMGKTKKELAEERKSLNAALKQNQQMILERRRLKAGNAELKQALEENIRGFGTILHTLIQHRVEENRGHGQRVAQIAAFIATEMGFGEKKLEDLRKAAMLHEIGLLFLAGGDFGSGFAGTENGDGGHSSGDGPAAYDRTLMVQYPVKGAELLQQCPGFEQPAQIIRQLNENADGTGYPDGVRRRYISMASKILAGADELERLRGRSDISGIDDILRGLEQLSGVRLDPVVVGRI